MAELVMTTQVGELKGVTPRWSRQAARMRRKTAILVRKALLKLGRIALELAAARKAHSRSMHSRSIRSRCIHLDGPVIPGRVWNRHSAYFVYHRRVRDIGCQQRQSLSAVHRTGNTMIPAGEGVRVKVVDYRPIPAWASGHMDWDFITYDRASSPAGFWHEIRRKLA